MDTILTDNDKKPEVKDSDVDYKDFRQSQHTQESHSRCSQLYRPMVVPQSWTKRAGIV